MSYIQFITLFLIIVSQINLISLQKLNSCSEGTTCKLITNCPDALLDAKLRKYQKPCDFVGLLPKVCCRQNQKSIVRKAVQKCKEYETHLIKVIKLFNRNVIKNTCPYTSIELVIGGVPAKPKEFPHMALIGYEKDRIPNDERIYACGGSLISEYFVLTAAHCLNIREHGPARFVRLGDLNRALTSDDARPQEIAIAQLIKHPQYHGGYNDIGLIRLRESVKFNDYIRPICLNTNTAIARQSATATGWGTTELGVQSDDLLKVPLDLFPFNKCKAMLHDRKRLSRGLDENMHLCAGSMELERDTCQGDSGGPLQVFNQNTCLYTQIGITSFGKTCGFGGIYTRVSYYVDWIEEIVWP